MGCHNCTDSFCSKKWNQVHSREQQTNILFRYPPSMHRLVFHHASPKTQEKGGKTTINAASEEVFGTMGHRSNYRRPGRYLSVGYLAAYCWQSNDYPRQRAARVGRARLLSIGRLSLCSLFNNLMTAVNSAQPLVF